MATYPLFSAAALTIAVFQTRKNAMAISSENRKTGIFTGDGKTTRYPFDFRILKTEHIAVITDDAIGNEHVLSEGRDYTAALETDGGHIDLAAPLGKGRRLVIISNQPYLQPAIFTNHGGFYPANLNDALDKLVIQDQQIREQVSRALKVSVISNVNLTLPAPSPGKGIGWNADGSGLENNNYPEQAAASAQAAQAAVRRAENLIGNAAFELSGQLPHTVPSIAKLRQHVDGGRPVLVAAYYEHGTVGGGVFTADPNDRTTPDDGGLTIVAADGTRWKRQLSGDTATLADFGILPDTGEPVGAAVNAALAACAGRCTLAAAAGEYLTEEELKLPSHSTFKGAGMDKTLFKAHPSLPAIANVFTNASNNYEVRSGYDRHITLCDLRIDCAWESRYQIGTHINNQACGVKLSAVEHCRVENVRAENAPLHCFDVSADQYSASYTPLTRSKNVVIENCVAKNPYRDDCFTCHDSDGVVFNNCTAIYDSTAHPLPAKGTQQGFEIDEGCSGCTVSNSYARGMTCGIQIKGHTNTVSARASVARDCVVEDVGVGIMFSVGRAGKADDRIVGNSADTIHIVSIDPAKYGGEGLAVLIYGADGVHIANLTNDSDRGIRIEQNAGIVTLRNIGFTAVCADTLVLIRNNSPRAQVSIDNLYGVAQTRRIIWKGAGLLKAQNIFIQTSNDSIRFDAFGKDSVLNMAGSQSGKYKSVDKDNAFSVSGEDTEIEDGRVIVRSGGGVPGTFALPQGSLWYTSGLNVYLNKGTAAAPNWVLWI